MIVDIINKKRLGQELTYQELDFFFNGYLNGDVKEYQMAALLMAISIQGMVDEEIFSLTKIFVDSGDILDLSFISGVKVDKHSTGGIGDKTTLIVGPIVACLGIPVIKMSGRGLGHTGGTIDKLESIPGFQVTLSEEALIQQVRNIGIVITSQTARLAPMDKLIYALRDVTGTVSSIPLIAASVMSKKIAGGTDKILIDIKVGDGALLQTQEEAEKLSELVINIGKYYDREVRTIISDMNNPLGFAIGNSLEVLEAIQILRGEETDNNLTRLCIELASEMVCMSQGKQKKEAIKLVQEAITSLQAYEKFIELIESQQGKLMELTVSRRIKKIKAGKSGIIEKIDALALGKLSVSLGAGRVNKDDIIDYEVGVLLQKQVGDKVKKGDVLYHIYYHKPICLQNDDKIFTIK